MAIYRVPYACRALRLPALLPVKRFQNFNGHYICSGVVYPSRVTISVGTSFGVQDAIYVRQRA